MPRGSKLRSKESLDKTRATRAKTREARQAFLIKINDTLRVTRDAYNVILSQKCLTEDSGKMYIMPLGYFSDFNKSITDRAKEAGATDEQIKRYLARVKPITVSYKLGKLVIKYPEDMIFDVRDPDEIEESEETEQDEPTD